MDFQTKQALVQLSDIMQESITSCMVKIDAQEKQSKLLQEMIEVSNKQVVQLQEQINNMSEWLTTISGMVKTLSEENAG